MDIKDIFEKITAYLRSVREDNRRYYEPNYQPEPNAEQSVVDEVPPVVLNNAGSTLNDLKADRKAEQSRRTRMAREIEVELAHERDAERRQQRIEKARIDRALYEELKAKMQKDEVALKQSNTDVLFAEYVLAVYGGAIGGTTPNSKIFKSKCERLLAERPELEKYKSARIYLLTVAGDKISSYATGYALYQKVTCYHYAGATCRKKLIPNLERYLAEADWSGLPNGEVQHGGTLKIDRNRDDPDGGVMLSQIDLNVSSLYDVLAKAYEGEYMFEQAIDAYKKGNEICPHEHFGITGQVGALVKMGRFDEAISLLKAAQKSQHYKPIVTRSAFSYEIWVDDNYKHQIDLALQDVLEKQARGYVYRLPKNINQ